MPVTNERDKRASAVRALAHEAKVGLIAIIRPWPVDDYFNSILRASKDIT